MKTSSKGLTLIKQFEGCRLTAYKCVSTEKYYTIGYGHYGADVAAGMKITQAQADAYLIADLAKFEGYVQNTAYCPITASLNQNQFDALVSFTYNCGAGNLKTLCAGRTAAQIAAKITAYNKSGGKVLTGLVNRRAKEQALFLEAVAQSSNQATQTSSGALYTIGKVYTLQNNMYVRATAAGSKKKYAALSANAKLNAKQDANGNGILKKGTSVTCKALQANNGATWMQIPSGWICAKASDGTVYVK